jgi:peptide/nickel transport system substrate-binding protein
MRGWNAIGLRSTFNVYERSVTYAKSSDNTMMFAGGQISNSPFIFAVPSHTAPVDHKLVNNMGASYALWHETSGAEGLEPPDDIKNLVRLHVEGAAQETEEGRAKYAQDILKLHAEEQWQLAMLGNNPDIYIASKDLRNVPTTWTASFINRYYAVTFPEQMWFGPASRR